MDRDLEVTRYRATAQPGGSGAAGTGLCSPQVNPPGGLEPRPRASRPWVLLHTLPIPGGPRAPGCAQPHWGPHQSPRVGATPCQQRRHSTECGIRWPQQGTLQRGDGQRDEGTDGGFL